METDQNIKAFLEKKIEYCNNKLRKLTKRKKRYNAFYVVLIVISIVCSAISAGLVSFVSLGSAVPISITLLSITASLSVTLSSRFKLKKKGDEVKNIIVDIDKIKQQLDYVIFCNGSLTDEDSKRIIKELVPYTA